MKDKLINHAIRQSYETSLAPEQYAAYVLFIEIDPHQVDVNVHPAKHEVRFHQARLVHDFIYQALSDALVQAKSIEAPAASTSAFNHFEAEVKPVASELDNATDANRPENSDTHTVSESLIQAVESIPAYPGRSDYQPNRDSDYSSKSHRRDEGVAEANPRNEWTSSSTSQRNSTKAGARVPEKAPSAEEVRVYQELMQTPDLPTPVTDNDMEQAVGRDDAINDVVIERVGKAIAMADPTYVLVKAEPCCALVSLRRAEFYRLFAQLDPKAEPLKMQPLLVPLSLKVTDQQRELAEAQVDLLLAFGIDIKVRNKQTLMVMGVPSPLRQQNLQLLIDEMLSYLATLEQQDISKSRLSLWLTKKVLQVKSSYTLSESVQILGNLEQLYDGKLPLSDPKFVRPVDFTATIAAFSS